MVLTDQERNALNEKIENPAKSVKCPRCGAFLECSKYPTAIQVRCTTENCIKKSIRGI